jgi:hypothetical protein
VAEECDGLPLALGVCGARARDGAAWSDLLDALNEADLEFLEFQDKSVLKALRVSVDALSDDERRRYLQLAAFPKTPPCPKPP